MRKILRTSLGRERWKEEEEKKKYQDKEREREREMKCNHGNTKLQNLNELNQTELKTFLQVS